MGSFKYKNLLHRRDFQENTDEDIVIMAVSVKTSLHFKRPKENLLLLTLKLQTLVPSHVLVAIFCVTEAS